MALRIVLPITLVIALAGCGSFGAIGLPWKREKPAEPEPLPAATSTVGSVESTDIGAPSADGNVDTVGGLPVDTGTSAADQPLAPPPGSTAMNAPTGSGVNGGLGRTDLLGGWTITSGNDSCQLFMTLTSWTGGYRASTRGCTTNLLKSISGVEPAGRQRDSRRRRGRARRHPRFVRQQPFRRPGQRAGRHLLSLIRDL